MEEAQLKGLQSEALSSEDQKLAAYKNLISEIKTITQKLKKYKEGDITCLGSESYCKVLTQLASLKRRQLVTSRAIKQRYAEEKKIRRDWVKKDPH